MTTLEFYNNLREKICILKEDNDIKDAEIEFPNTQIKMLEDLFVLWSSEKEEKDLMIYIKDILKNPKKRKRESI